MNRMQTESDPECIVPGYRRVEIPKPLGGPQQLGTTHVVAYVPIEKRSISRRAPVQAISGFVLGSFVGTLITMLLLL